MKRLTEELNPVQSTPKHFGARYIQKVVSSLADYERTGLTPEQIRELKERNTVKNPVHSQFKSEMVCPACRSTAYPWYTFCVECGQRLWDDEKP